MADNKAATAAAQTQSDKPKKNDGKKRSPSSTRSELFQRDRQVFQRYEERAKKVVWPSKNDVKTNTITVTWSCWSQLSC